MKTELVVGDFETYWSDTHSLSNMTALEYVMSPKTELISLALKKEGKAVCWFGEKNIREGVSRIDWSNKLLVAHNNSEFDALIFAFRLGIKPRMWGCTLAMARPIHAKDVGGSLAALVEHYGLGKKDSTALLATKGKHLKDFTPEEIAAMRTYNMMDTEQCYNLFYKLLAQTPKSEMQIINATIRMLVEPQFVVDEPLLTKTLVLEQEHKRDMLISLAVKLGVGSIEDVRKTLASAPKFAALLTDNGVPVPMKLNPKGKPIPALAKTDEGFIALTEHENDLVAAAANTRLGVKSTQLETRIVKLIDAAHHCNGRLPVPIKYYGADTTGRWSGFWYNLQNLPRILRSAPKLSDALRYSLMAPPGYKVVVADLSGIELRVNLTLWKVPYAMAMLAADPEADLYKPLASEVLGVPIEDMPKMVRQAGKAMSLGCGFGLANHEKYIAVAKQMAQLVVTPEEAEMHIAGYRNKHPEVVQGWKTCHRALDYIYSGDEAQIDSWGLCHTSKDGIVTPKGVIRYPDLRKEVNEDSGKVEWVYGTGRKKARIYAGKVTENCLAAGTLVLTDNGWKPIERVGHTDRVHDGDAFVAHAGVVLKSVQHCVTVDGVYMTPDHEVLNELGEWEEASQLPRPYRPTVRRADRLAPRSQRRKEVALAVPVRLRKTGSEVRTGRNWRSDSRRSAELWVSVSTTDVRKTPHPRDVEAPSVRSVQKHARPVPPFVAQSVEKLWCARYSGVRAVAAKIRELLDRYGAVVREWAGLGSSGQQPWVLAGELSVGYAEDKYAEQTKQSRTGHHYTVCRDRNFEVDSILPAESRLVFDIANAGPQNRFVVLGAGGPFIVHNCVQHLARHVLSDNMIEVRRQTEYWPVHTVHDELIYIAPDDEAGELLDTVQAVMRTPPIWWPELVTYSEGSVGDNYGEAK